MSDQLYQKFHTLFSLFTKNEDQINNYWLDIHQNYTKKSRHYHNLAHLQNMFNELDQYHERLEDPAILQCSIFYHDIIYKATSKKNEMKSAEHARQVLTELDIKAGRIRRCTKQIMFTQNHLVSSSVRIDEKLLVDLDLEILSRDWEEYKIYSQQIRKEYAIYPTLIYRKGRKKALTTFLERENIYQTEKYSGEKEVKARENIRREIETLL